MVPIHFLPRGSDYVAAVTSLRCYRSIAIRYTSNWKVFAVIIQIDEIVRANQLETRYRRKTSLTDILQSHIERISFFVRVTQVRCAAVTRLGDVCVQCQKVVLLHDAQACAGSTRQVVTVAQCVSEEDYGGSPFQQDC